MRCAGRWPLILILALTALAGCAGSGPVADGNPQAELRTASDQTDDQKRARIRLQLAIDYYGQRQLDTALDEIKKALLADPAFAEAYGVRGLIYMDMGETRLADENLLRALRLQPGNPDFANNYGWFLCRNGREKEAIPYFETALANKAYQSPAKALNNAGVCSLKLKDRAAAEKYFTRAFQYEPGNPSVNANLANIYFLKGNDERARFYIDRATKAEVPTPDILWVGIKIERKLGRRSAEASLVTQLRRRYPESPEYAAYLRGAFDE